VFVLVEESAEPIVSADVQMCEPGKAGDRFGQRIQRPGVRNTPMGTVTVVVPFVLAQGVQQMRLAPDQRSVERFVTAGLDPLAAGLDGME
jgi:hypothetical protein